MVGLVGFERRGLKETIKTRNVQPFVLKFKDITFFKKNKRKQEKRKRKKVDKERKRKKKKRKEKKVFPKKVLNNVYFLKKLASKKNIYLYHYAPCMVFLQTNTDLMSVYNTI